MTIEQTRQLGIEFERRVQTMIPEREFLNKLDTETIYSFLNQYQDKYIHEIYRNLDNIPTGSKLSAHIESILQSLLRSVNLKVEGDSSSNTVQDSNNVIIDTARSHTFVLPDTFYMYVRSVSNVTSTFSYKGGNSAEQNIKILPNQLVSQNDVWKLIETPHDSLRILRYPAVVLNQHYDHDSNVDTEKVPTITVVYDRYTTIVGVRVLYYAQPVHFNIMTSTPCELPMDAFDDLVTGAVDLYVQYAAGAEANKRRQDEARRQQAKEENKRRRDNDEDED
jgi:hypothetical protein